MHTRTLRKAALALTFWLALYVSALKAQIFTAPLQASTTGTDPVDFEFRADGTMIAKGNFGVGSLLSGDQGDGTRLLWFPSLGALRAGTVSTGDSIGSGPWDAGNIGANSVAFGNSTSAYGANSFAIGWASSASGGNSVAMGLFSSASGSNSIAIGSTATGVSSVAIGAGATASGWYAGAFGAYTLSSGTCSTAFGGATTASGNYSTASGSYTQAAAEFDFVLGTYNVGGGSATSWVATDPILEIGNGTSTTPSDALVVYKNGNVTAQGVITAAPGGDIPMYTGD